MSRRGDPLFLSNADWLLIRKWRRSGLPLRIALRGIADALDGHAHSWGRKRKVGSLAYCAAEVDAARERWQRALSFDDEAETSVSVALTSFADALEAATGLGGRGGAAARSAAAEVRAWTVPAAGGPPRLEQLTRRLGATEKALLEALRADAEPTTLATILREIEADLAPYRGPGSSLGTASPGSASSTCERRAPGAAAARGRAHRSDGRARGVSGPGPGPPSWPGRVRAARPAR